MEATGTPRTAGHPGLLILDRVRLLILDYSSWTTHPGAHIFPVPGPALFINTRYGLCIPVALRRILDSVRRYGSSDGPSIPGHPGPGQGHLIPLILDGG